MQIVIEIDIKDNGHNVKRVITDYISRGWEVVSMTTLNKVWKTIVVFKRKADKKDETN